MIVIADMKKNSLKIQAGVLRRLSFLPTKQIRIVTHVIIHREYTHEDMKNYLALLQLHKPLKFNRWVQPTCLPEARPPLGPVSGALGFYSRKRTRSPIVSTVSTLLCLGRWRRHVIMILDAIQL